MEKYVILLAVCLLTVSLPLVPFVQTWLKARKEQKDMGRLKAGSVWRLRSNILRNDPFAEDARHLVTVQETRLNSDGRMWVMYQHTSGLVETDPADVFVHLYRYVEDQDQAIKGDEVQRMAKGMVRIAKQEKKWEQKHLR